MESWNLELAEAAFAEAAVDPTRWTNALEVVTTLSGSYGAILIPVTGTGPVPGIPFTERLAPSAEAYFRDGWNERDERFNGVPQMVRSRVVDDLDIFDADTIKRLPYYQEFLAPFGLRWFAGIGIMTGDDVWCLSMQRSIAQGPFSPEQKLQFTGLARRLSSSAALARAVGAAAADSALDAFETSGTAVVLVNRRGEVFKANACAEQLLVGDVTIVERQLVARDAQATAALQRALHDLIRRRDGSGLAAPVPLPRSGQRPLLAYPVKLASLAANALADCHCAIVLKDPDSRNRPLQATLQSSFLLTPAEARLAWRLASGETVAAAADALGVTKETSRTQLRNIFTKTGTHRQAELVALLTSMSTR